MSVKKRLSSILMIVLLLLVSIIVLKRNSEPVYYTVDETGKERSLFRLSQIKNGMTRRSVIDLLGEYYTRPLSSGFDDLELHTMYWSLSDGSTLVVHFERAPGSKYYREIIEDEDSVHIVTEEEARAWREYLLDAFIVKDFNIVLPEKNNDDPGFPGQWLDWTGCWSVFEEDYKQVKVGMTFERVVGVIGRPNSINVDYETNMIIIDWLIDPQGVLRIEFEKVGEGITEKTIVVREITVIDQQ